MPRPLARRIDRLSRAAHAFHRFAHHPLCPAYAGETFRLGRVRLCRGCSLAAAGGLAGLAAGAVLPPADSTLLAGLAILAALAGLVPLASARLRAGKGATRLLPAGLAAFLAFQGLRAASPFGLLLAAMVAAGVAAGLLAYRRRGPDRGPCAACPEAPPGPACAGLRPIHRRERAFQRLASRWIAVTESFHARPAGSKIMEPGGSNGADPGHRG